MVKGRIHSVSLAVLLMAQDRLCHIYTRSVLLRCQYCHNADTVGNQVKVKK